MTSIDTTNKPFKVEKRQVYEAYKAVKSNKGAAGVDGQTIEQFEADLGDNLYKIWNRMSSGRYFPPPVRAVSIPKKSGGERIAEADRRRSDRADGGQTADRAEPRSYIPGRLLRLQTGKIGSGCGRGHAKTVLEIRLGFRVR